MTLENPEEAMDEEIKLQCDGDGCDNEATAERAELVERGWEWKEGSVTGLFKIFAVQCPECDIDIPTVFEKKKDSLEDYYEKHESPPGRSKSPNQTTLSEV